MNLKELLKDLPYDPVLVESLDLMRVRQTLKVAYHVLNDHPQNEELESGATWVLEAVIADLEQVEKAGNDRAMPYFHAKMNIQMKEGGDGIGGGVYQLVEDVILKHKSDVVLPHLLQALASPHRSVRYWCVQIAAVFPHPDLIAPLAVHLAQADDFDMRYAAVTALEQIGDARALEVLRDALAVSKVKRFVSS